MVGGKRWRASGGFAGMQPVACIRKTAVWDIHTRHLARNYPSFLSLHWSEEVWLSGYFLQADGGSAACCLGRCLSGLPLFAPTSDFVTQL